MYIFDYNPGKHLCVKHCNIYHILLILNSYLEETLMFGLRDNMEQFVSSCFEYLANYLYNCT